MKSRNSINNEVYGMNNVPPDIIQMKQNEENGLYVDTKKIRVVSKFKHDHLVIKTPEVESMNFNNAPVNSYRNMPIRVHFKQPGVFTNENESNHMMSGNINNEKINEQSKFEDKFKGDENDQNGNSLYKYDAMSKNINKKNMNNLKSSHKVRRVFDNEIESMEEIRASFPKYFYDVDEMQG